jgi:hypothetical protein
MKSPASAVQDRATVIPIRAAIMDSLQLCISPYRYWCSGFVPRQLSFQYAWAEPLLAGVPTGFPSSLDWAISCSPGEAGSSVAADSRLSPKTRQREL